METLKLNKIGNHRIDSEGLNRIKAGTNNPGDGSCGCGCCYEGTPGGSSVQNNGMANSAKGLWSSDCDIKVTYAKPVEIIFKN